MQKVYFTMLKVQMIIFLSVLIVDLEKYFFVLIDIKFKDSDPSQDE